MTIWGLRLEMGGLGAGAGVARSRWVVHLLTGHVGDRGRVAAVSECRHAGFDDPTVGAEELPGGWSYREVAVGHTMA